MAVKLSQPTGLQGVSPLPSVFFPWKVIAEGSYRGKGINDACV